MRARDSTLAATLAGLAFITYCSVQLASKPAAAGATKETPWWRAAEKR
jgi:hypothetical protein